MELNESDGREMSYDDDESVLTTDAVHALELARREALIARDVAAMRALISPTCVYVHSIGLVESGLVYLDQFASGGFGYESLEAEDLDVVITGPVAVAVFRQAAQMVIDGERHTSLSRCTATWLHHEGATSLIAFQATRMAA